jgi:membrane protease YdiL (CAAX protease family)
VNRTQVTHFLFTGRFVDPTEPLDEPFDDSDEPKRPVSRNITFREVPWRLWHAVVGFAPFITLSVVAMIVPVRVIPLAVVLSLAMFCYFWMLVLPLIVARRNGWRPRWAIQPAQMFLEFLIASLTVSATWMLIAVGYAIWVALFGEPPPSSNPVTEAALSPNLIVVIVIVVLACVGAPLTEEVFFRGLLYNALRRVIPWPVAVLIQAVAFGLMHAAGGVMYVVVTGAIGVTFGLVYQFRKTLLTPIFCHGIHNTAVTAIVFVTLGWTSDPPALGIAVKDDNNGAVVTSVTPGSGADAAGLREGDVLSSVNGFTVRNTLEVRTAIHNKKPGETVPVEYIRNGESHRVEILLKSRRELTPK